MSGSAAKKHNQQDGPTFDGAAYREHLIKKGILRPRAPEAWGDPSVSAFWHTEPATLRIDGAGARDAKEAIRFPSAVVVAMQEKTIQEYERRWPSGGPEPF